MTIPKEEFDSWFSWARTQFSESGPYPLIDHSFFHARLLTDGQSEWTDHDATREYLESVLVASQEDLAVRFVILNYYHGLQHFNPQLTDIVAGVDPLVETTS